MVAVRISIIIIIFRQAGRISEKSPCYYKGLGGIRLKGELAKNRIRREVRISRTNPVA